MSDIVERLRREQDKTGPLYGPLFGEAAAEIERLRAQVVALQSSLDTGPPISGKKTPDALERK